MSRQISFDKHRNRLIIEEAGEGRLWRRQARTIVNSAPDLVDQVIAGGK
jgi:hypothetical protein